MFSESGSMRIARLNFLLAAISLAFTITNYIFVSALFTITSAILVVFFGSTTLRLTRLHFSVILLFIYFFLSVLFYSPEALFEFDFYRRDGNFFITFAPLFLYGFFPIKLNLRSVLFYYLVWVTVANLVGIGCFLQGLLPNWREYTFFFHAHNAAGGFLCAILGACIALWLQRRDWISLIMVCVNGFGVYLTQSRGSILGLLLALTIVFIFKDRHLKKAILLVSTSLAFLLSWTYPIWKKYGMQDSSHSIDLVDPELFDRVGTVVDRGFFLWPRAVYLWLQSPFLGTGFGSYNDVPYEFVGKKHVFSWNRPAKFIYSDAHAHQSFLNVLAETGVIGLALVIYCLIEIYYFIHFLDEKWLGKALLVIFWLNVWSSFTEHRLFTPSQMLPFTILVALGMSYQRARQDKQLMNALGKQHDFTPF